MNRRVLAALVCLARVHRMKEEATPDHVLSDSVYGALGVALETLDVHDQVLYEELARRLCKDEETIASDPVGVKILDAACAGLLLSSIAQVRDDPSQSAFLEPRPKRPRDADVVACQRCRRSCLCTCPEDGDEP